MKIKAHYNGNITITSGYVNKDPYKFSKNDRTKKRIQKLNYSKYRHLSGNAARMFEIRENKILFLTFTLKDNVQLTGITNKAWSYFLNLMTKRHGLNSYLWVAEHQKRGAIHYHVLLDMPFIPYQDIKNIFANSFSIFDIKVSSKNSVSASKSHGAIVKNVEQALRYITKYMSKQLKADLKRDTPRQVINIPVMERYSSDKKTPLSGRIYAFSNKINEKPLEITYDEFLEVANTISKEYNFKYSATYICDLSAVIELFASVKARRLALFERNNTFRLPVSKEMPIFEAYKHKEFKQIA